VYTPVVHDHRVKLGGNARLEDSLLEVCGDTTAVVNDREGATVIISRGGNENPARIGITGIAQHLDDDVLDTLDIMLCLTTLSLRTPQAYKSIAEAFLNT
jgi:hypothetical protein